jgi:hypothetical protein
MLSDALRLQAVCSQCAPHRPAGHRQTNVEEEEEEEEEAPTLSWSTQRPRPWQGFEAHTDGGTSTVTR